MRYRIAITVGILYFACAVAQAAPPIQELHLGVGIYPTENNIAFYTPLSYELPLYVEVTPTDSLIDGEFPETATRVSTSSRATYTDYRSHKALISGLVESTSYTYRVGNETDGWTPHKTFSTQHNNNFNFLVAGDPQVGTKFATVPDPVATAQAHAANWQRVMQTAATQFPTASFFVSPGDVVDRQYEYMFNALLSSDIVSTLPSLMLEASHDDDAQPKSSSIFHQHIYQPDPATPANDTKGFFWFKRGDVLFICTNHHNIDNKDVASYIAQAVEQFPDSKWRIYITHYSYYAAGNHADSNYETPFRQLLAPILDNMGIDLVIFGHDHTYVRTPQLLNDTPVATTAHPGSPVGVLNPQGAVYITANSSSGSKYYNLVADIESRYYIAHVRQNYTPSFLNIEINGNDLTIKAYEVGDDNSTYLFDQYRIHKTAIRPIFNTDYDNDGHLNADDLFPFDYLDWKDWDGDGIGDNLDDDDDNDGIPDNRDADPYRAYIYPPPSLKDFCPSPILRD